MSATDRKNNTQLLSLLAARRRQIIQNRLTHLTTIADAVSETTTQLNQILSTIIPTLRNGTQRVYIDIRTFRQNQQTNQQNLGNRTTNLNTNNTNHQSNSTERPQERFNDTRGNIRPQERFNDTRENVSQLAQNASKLFQNASKQPRKTKFGKTQEKRFDLEHVGFDTLGGIAERVEEEDLLDVEESNHDLYLVNFTTKVVSRGNESKKLDTLFMSDSLYNHFRPLETNLPEDEIQPFLYFGQKLISTTPKVRQRYDPKRHTDESTLMDLSVERQHQIANKILNIRPPTPPKTEFYRTNITEDSSHEASNPIPKYRPPVTRPAYYRQNRTYYVLPKRSAIKRPDLTTKVPQIKVVTSVSIQTEIVKGNLTTTQAPSTKFQIIVPDEITTYTTQSEEETTTNQPKVEIITITPKVNKQSTIGITQPPTTTPAQTTTPQTTTIATTTTSATTPIRTTTTTPTTTTTTIPPSPTYRPLLITKPPETIKPELKENNLGLYILLATCIGVLPLTIIVGFIIRNILSRRFIPVAKKGFDSEASDILSENTASEKQHEKKPKKHHHHHQSSHHHQQSHVSQPMNLVKGFGTSSGGGVNNNNYTTENSRWEFSRNKLRLKTLLGEGNFGQVSIAIYDNIFEL